MQGGGILLEAFYQLIDLTHPPAHELLSAMEEVVAPARAAMIFGAVVAAPLFEETFFRGHIQSLLASVQDRIDLAPDLGGAAVISAVLMARLDEPETAKIPGFAPTLTRRHW